MLDQNMLVQAIRASWSKETSELPEQWTPDNPAMGHCDVSSFVAWEHLGGDLVLGQVHNEGEFQEYHFWNRIDGVDLDLTRSQFKEGEVVTEHKVLEAEFLAANKDVVRPEVAARIATFRSAVNSNLAPS